MPVIDIQTLANTVLSQAAEIAELRDDRATLTAEVGRLAAALEAGGLPDGATEAAEPEQLD